MKTIFAKLLTEDEYKLEANLTELANELTEFRNECVVCLKVEGVLLSLCLELGNVRFVPGDEYFISELRSKASIIIDTIKSDNEGKESIKQTISQQITTELYGDCVGVITVNAEPIRAYEIGKEEVRRAIDLLRFSSKAIYPLKEDIRIGLKGDHPKTNRYGFIFSEKGLNTQGDSVGSVLPFEINQESLEIMENIGVFAVSMALQKKQSTNLEESIIRSIHWFSVALTQDENGNAFLFLIVALESLFKAERGNSIGGTVAESVAFLMSDELDGRKQIVSIVRQYYGMRSGVAHGGKKTINDTELSTLMNIAGTSIMVTIKKLDKFSSQNEFMSWIEDKKLT